MDDELLEGESAKNNEQKQRALDELSEGEWQKTPATDLATGVCLIVRTTRT